MSATHESPPPASGVILLPGEKFIMRRIPLVPDGDPAPQIELALEALSPFPPAQLYFGWVVAPDRRHAVIYASYRRNFPAEETSTWTGAEAVLPDFIAWLSTESHQPGTVLHRNDSCLTLVRHDGESALPAAIHAVTALDGNLDSARDRLPMPESGLRSAEGPTSIQPAPGGAWSVSVAGCSVTLTADFLRAADVRDKAILAAHRRTRRRDLWLWRAFAGLAAGLALCAATDLSLAAGRAALSAQRGSLNAQSSAVEEIRAAQTLAVKLEELAEQRLRPFEMLAAVNAVRPASIEFSRVTTEGLRHLSVRAQTANAADLPAFENALRKLPGIEKAELEDRRARDGFTTFQLEVTFRIGWEKPGGGA